MHDALGQVWLFARDAAGRVIQETDFSGLVFNYTYDTVGRVIKRQHCDGSWLDYFYDKSGLLIKEQAYGADGLLEDQTTFHYDNRDMLIRSENKSATLSFKRDAVGRIIRETKDGRGMKTYSTLLDEAIRSMIAAKESSDIDSLFSGGRTTALLDHISGLDDFELIAFLVIAEQL